MENIKDIVFLNLGMWLLWAKGQVFFEKMLKVATERTTKTNRRACTTLFHCLDDKIYA